MLFTSQELLAKVNTKIDTLAYMRQPANLYEPIQYVLSLGGKRIRPVLMLMAYNMYQSEVEGVLDPAVGLEIYHNFTLLHDDLMDEADMRRGQLTVHKKWNANTAILSGDAMLSLSNRYLLHVPDPYVEKVMAVFTETSVEIAEGQQYDMDFENRTDVSEEEYIEMIRLKTSVLLACCAKIGAILGGASDEDADNLYRFGENIGLAFQLQDDYLDVYGDTAVFGKRIGGDILCGKKTFLYLSALHLASRQQSNCLKKWMNVQDILPEEKIKAVTEVYNKCGVPDLCRKKQEGYYQQALRCLEKVSLPEEQKQMLRAFMASLMNRIV